MADHIKNEQLREYCYMGDLDLLKHFCRADNPNLNAQNKMNGW